MKQIKFSNKQIAEFLITFFIIVSGIALIYFFTVKKPDDSETVRLYSRAGETYAQGRFDDTIEILKPLQKFPPALILKAKAYYFSDNQDLAEKTFKQVLVFRPSSVEAKIFLARIYYEKGNYDEATKLTEALLADNPNDIQTLHLASQFANAEGKDDEALVFLNRAAELSSSCALVLLDRARMNWVSGHSSEALEDLSRAKAMLPWDTPLMKSIQNLERTIRGAM